MAGRRSRDRSRRGSGADPARPADRAGRLRCGPPRRIGPRRHHPRHHRATREGEGPGRRVSRHRRASGGDGGRGPDEPALRLHADDVHTAPGCSALRPALLVPGRHCLRRLPRHVGSGRDQPLGGHRQSLSARRAGAPPRPGRGQPRRAAGDLGRARPARPRHARRDARRGRGARPDAAAWSAGLRLHPQHRVARAHLPESGLDALHGGLRHHAAHPALAPAPHRGPGRRRLRQLLQRRLLPVVHLAPDE